METSASPPEVIAARMRLPHGAPHVGSTIKHYEILRQLGAGGMGTVFLARDTKLARMVAIKVLLEPTSQSAKRFLEEARATARCKHENIVVIHDVGEIDGYPYMVLEYLEGRTLRDWASEALSRLTSPSFAVELMIPVVSALCCAHQLGIVHRDLKPSNIFLTNAGKVVVLDFGIAKRLDAYEISIIAAAGDPLEKRIERTQEGALQGTLPYMSPEQWRAEEIDPRSDLWAVGVILYELCTGTHPLAPLTLDRLSQIKDLNQPMPSVGGRRSDMGALGAVIDRCLKKRKSDRFGSAEELLAELERLLPDQAVPALSEDESPFAGLAAFQEADAARFFGRDRDVASLLGRLHHQPLVAVAGPSGAGKSSLVRAGVIAALKRSGERWETFLLRPGRRPLAALAEVLIQVAEAVVESASSIAPEASPDGLIAALLNQPGLLGVRLRARCRRQGGPHRILLFVDQFEELYTLGTDPAERAAFVACLLGAADDASSPLRVTLAIRSDFVDRMADNRPLMAEVTRGLFFLPPVGRDGLHEALTRPINAVGYQFESEQMILSILGALERTPSPLPLLQFTAAKLWEARNRERRLLTRDSYDKLGGIAGALSAHADTILAALSFDDQRLCRAVFLRVVTPERTRAVVSLQELRGLSENPSTVEQVIQHLSDARLLLVEQSGEPEGTTVELVHESLIERWAKLKQWLDENEQDAQFLARVRVAAQQWEASGESEGVLWRDRAAYEAAQCIERLHAQQAVGSHLGLGKREERFLLSVVALSERARRRNRRVTAGVFTALSGIAIVVSLLAVRASREATRAREEAARADRAAAVAQVEARQARNATRVARAHKLENDPTTALALLREVEPPGVPKGWSDLTFRALRSRISYVLLTHPDAVRSATWSPDGKHIVTASEDMTARVWNADGTGKPRVLRGHEGAVRSAAWSPDGKRIVTASEDMTARVWNADGTGKPRVLRGHEGAVRSAAWSPDSKHIVTASEDMTARVWNVDGTGKPRVLRGHEGMVFSVAWSPDGSLIVTASEDMTARVWNADGTGKPRVLRGHEGWVLSAAWSPDSSRIVTASSDTTARVWDGSGISKPRILRGHKTMVFSAAWSPDGQHIVTASEDATARLWNLDGIGEPLPFQGHNSWVYSVAWSPDGKRIVTASHDKTARLWDIDGIGEPRVLRGHDDMVFSARFSRDGKRIVTASWDKTARVWNADGTGTPLVLRGHTSMLGWAEFSPGGERIVTASWDKTARVWNADGTGTPLVLRGHQNFVESAAWSPDGKRIVTASRDKTARVWNADGTGTPLVLHGHDGMVFAVTWSPNGQYIVTGSRDKTARVWNADGTGTPLVLRGHTGWITSVAWSPDGRRIVTASDDKTARVWNADGTGTPLVLHGHEKMVFSAAWSPDGKYIVTASKDTTARVWNADGTGEPLVLRGHDGEVQSAAWSPDGRSIVTASDDKTVRVWTHFAPLVGPDAPELWRATSYCLSIERRIELLSVSEATARADQQACERRAEAARGPDPLP